ncbi:MAG: 2-succinyl-5-enolpyruvyl-6-hydroxy-3-cyclohexene-1-carboxylic-acid synthase [Rhodocyclaceae bacterium]|nr:2-succinyl-5-enolpyruvyl-6-hydroxy-3-cyclohexene-1-carboxylic-acid synthase [Rhodocyclaceae bacterium]
MNNLEWADAFVAGLVAAGLRRAVIAPGARSSPLALACLRRPELLCEVITDERVAGYFALGLARAEGRPAAVLTTSGTAAANLLPAIVEANLASVPMIVLTADRPPEAHGWGANQAIDPARIYGVHARAFHALPPPDGAVPANYLHALAARLVEESQAPLPGPVHANLPFREPLLPDVLPPAPPLPAPIAIARALAPEVADLADLAARLSGRRGVILCGEAAYPTEFGAAVCALAARLGAPVLAEPLSNLRFCGLPVFSRQSAFLREAGLKKHAGPPQVFLGPLGGECRKAAFSGGGHFKPDWVLRFGGFPVSRTLERWLAGLAEAEHLLVAPPGRWPDPLWRADRMLRCDPLPLAEGLLDQPLRPAPGDWIESFRAAESRAQAAAHAGRAPKKPFEGSVAATLLSALPEGARCFVGNSLAIRAVDLFSGVGAKALTLHGNRGASGIDGNVATTAGIAAGSGAPTAALIGDQAALHDCGGFAALRGRNVVVVVMNNGGGGIFDHLPLAAKILKKHAGPPQVFLGPLGGEPSIRPRAAGQPKAGPAERDAALPHKARLSGGDIFDRAWIAPPHIDFAALAVAHGLTFRHAPTCAALAAGLASAFAVGGPWLIEVPVDRADSLARFDAYLSAAAL